jgi:xanthine dehydrogenase accessory factor
VRGARLPAAEAVRHAREALAGGEPAVGVSVLEVRLASAANEPARNTGGSDETDAGGPASPESPVSSSTEDTGSSGDAEPDGAPPVDEAPVDGPRAGDHLVVWADRHTGTFGDEALDAETVRLAREVLSHGAKAGTREVDAGAMACTLYLEAHRAPPELLIVGAGHIARPLCRIGAMLGFRVTVLDDRPEFATRERFPEAERVLRADFSEPFRGIGIGSGTHLVLVTRGHKYDFEALRDVLARPALPAYVGMVGSRRRTRAALEQLAREGVAPERLRAVHAPVGLDIRAETPEEIAVSIAAEMVAVRRGGTGQPLRDRARVVERWIEPARGAGAPPPNPHPSPDRP